MTMKRASLQSPDHLRELMPHGNVMFPLMVHEIDTDSRFGERVGCHWHDEFEILAVTSGAARIHIDERCYDVEKGSVVFVPADHLHMMTGTPGVPFSFVALVFHRAFLESGANDVIQQQYLDSVVSGETLFPEHLCAGSDQTGRVYALVEETGRIFWQRAPGYELLVRARMLEIWYHFFIRACKREQRTAGEAGGAERAVLTKSVIAYIKQNYEREIPLAELSERFNISQGHLCRVFKSMTGMSLSEYANAYRVSISAELLRNTRMDIGIIAGLAGFNNISYFNRIFRRFMHETPSGYRRELSD